MEIGSSSTTTTTKNPQSNQNTKSHKLRNICLTITVLIIVIVLIVVILGFTVFKPKRAVTTINSVKLDDFDVSFDITKLKVNLNLTLIIDLSIENPNKVGFKYKNSSAILYYRGEIVGEAPIVGDEIGPGETLPMNVSLTLIADRLLSRGDLYKDVFSGALTVSTYTRISGKVIILKFVRFHVVSETSCDVSINVGNRSVSDQQCKYKTML